MKADRSTIVNMIHCLWPGLVDGLPGPTNIAVPDATYWVPDIETVRGVIERSFVKLIKYQAELFDCDNFALSFSAYCKEYRLAMAELHGLPLEECYEWPVGIVWGSRFHGQPMGHAIDLICSRQGVYLYEPQSKEDLIWLADPTQDQAHLVVL